MHLQALHPLAGERSLDEAMQGEISNLLVGESCQNHCLQDLKVWLLNEGLDNLFELSGSVELELLMMADGSTC